MVVALEERLHGWGLDTENRLTSVTGNGTTTFVYDGDGARVKKVDATGTTAYVGAIEVLITSTLRVTRTYYSAGQLVGMRVVTSTGGNTLYYLHTDHLGSASLTTNSSGGEVARQSYYPYGAVRNPVGGMPTDIGFTGQRAESGLGSLMFFQARYYSPAVGRFLSADTIVPDPSNPQGLNRFGYSLSNPLKYTDPSGHCPAPAASMGPVICLALFIKPDRVSALGSTLHGDGRDFSSNSDPGASRAYIYIPVGDPNQWEAHANQTGYIVPVYGAGGDYTPPEIIGETIMWTGPSSRNKWTVTPFENSDIAVTYDLVLAGNLEDKAPHINGTILFKPNGSGGYNTFGYRDGFPWAEAYYYDDQGNVQTIFQRPALSGTNGDPFDLYAIERYDSYPFHDFGKFVLGNNRKKDVFWTSSNWSNAIPE